MVVKRTRPGSKGRPERTVMQPLNAPYPGCCTPFPDVTFKPWGISSIYAHHQGPQCKGYMESMSLEEWNAELDARAAARRGDIGDD